MENNCAKGIKAEKKSRMETSEGRKLIRPTLRSLPGKYREIHAEGEEVRAGIEGESGVATITRGRQSVRQQHSSNFTHRNTVPSSESCTSVSPTSIFPGC